VIWFGIKSSPQTSRIGGYDAKIAVIGGVQSRVERASPALTELALRNRSGEPNQLAIGRIPAVGMSLTGLLATTHKRTKC
jgi:hypothetical protein